MSSAVVASYKIVSTIQQEGQDIHPPAWKSFEREMVGDDDGCELQGGDDKLVEHCGKAQLNTAMLHDLKAMRPALPAKEQRLTLSTVDRVLRVPSTPLIRLVLSHVCGRPER